MSIPAAAIAVKVIAAIGKTGTCFLPDSWVTVSTVVDGVVDVIADGTIDVVSDAVTEVVSAVVTDVFVVVPAYATYKTSSCKNCHRN